MENRSWNENERKAVAGLVAAWDAMVAEGDMDELEMAATLVEQLERGRSWDDTVATDAENNPELAALVGLDPDSEDDQDDAWEAWTRAADEAARQWLGAHPEAEAEARAELG